MCIIAAKPAGVAMPGETTLKNMWDHNPDGAGIMYPVMGKRGPEVRILKGFMTWKDFSFALEHIGGQVDLLNTSVVLHFRITTHGGTCPELTHPFPVSGSPAALRSLDSRAPVGVAHNGVIRAVTSAKDMSDTSEYIKSQLWPLYQAMPKFYESKPCLELINNAIQSKMAFLDGAGKIVTVGEWLEHDGVMYSNSSYQSYSSYRSVSSNSVWGAFTGDCYDDLWACSTVRRLYPLPEGGYVRASDGDMADDTMGFFAIDKKDRVYEFYNDVGLWAELEGWEAFNRADLPLKFDPKDATSEDTISAEYYDLLAAYYDDCGAYDNT